jgi:hypothetical protein
LGCCSLGSLFSLDLHWNCRNYYVMTRTSCSLGNKLICLHHPLEVFIKKNNRSTWERGAGLGWVVAGSGPFIFRPDLQRNCFKYYVMARTSHSLGNYNIRLHHSSEVRFKDEHMHLEEGCWSSLGCCSLWPIYFLSRSSQWNCRNYYVMARTSL